MIILGSASPRRKQLLESVGIEVVTESADIDESHREGEKPREYAERMALEKARKVAGRHAGMRDIIVAADTSVVLGEEILGKPADRAEASKMLHALSNREHCVMTGVCIIDSEQGCERSFVSVTRVHFCELSDERIARYIASGEPMDKAGAYGIQGGAAGFVERIEGSYTNVVGLPLCETIRVLDVLLKAQALKENVQ